MGYLLMIYRDALTELLEIVNQPAVPGEMIVSAARLVGRVDLCLVAKCCKFAAPLAGDAEIRFEPSDGFLTFLSAVRARNWPSALDIARRLLSAPMVSAVDQ
jgi:hypothetical protein